MTNKCNGMLIAYVAFKNKNIFRVWDTTTENSHVMVLQPEAAPQTGPHFALF